MFSKVDHFVGGIIIACSAGVRRLATLAFQMCGLVVHDFWGLGCSTFCLACIECAGLQNCNRSDNEQMDVLGSPCHMLCLLQRYFHTNMIECDHCANVIAIWCFTLLYVPILSSSVYVVGFHNIGNVHVNFKLKDGSICVSNALIQIFRG